HPDRSAPVFPARVSCVCRRTVEGPWRGLTISRADESTAIPRPGRFLGTQSRYNAAGCTRISQRIFHFWGIWMKSEGKNASIDRRDFLTAPGAGLIAAAVPTSAASGTPAPFGSTSSAASEPARAKPTGELRRIPIGVFDPVYDKLSLDQMLDT